MAKIIGKVTGEGYYLELKEALRKKRCVIGMSSVECAAKLGISRSYFAELEKGIHTPTLYILFEWVKILNVSIDEVVYGQMHNPRNKRIIDLLADLTDAVDKSDSNSKTYLQAIKCFLLYKSALSEAFVNEPNLFVDAISAFDEIIRCFNDDSTKFIRKTANGDSDIDEDLKLAYRIVQLATELRGILLNKVTVVTVST